MPGSTRSYEMAKRWVEAGHHVDVVSATAPPGTEGWHCQTVDGVNVHNTHIPYSNEMSYANRIRAFIRFAWQSGRRAQKIGGDLVFATSTPLTIALPATYAASRLRIPMVFEVRDLWPELPIAVGALRNPLLIGMARRLERFAYRRSEQIIALSPGMAEGVASTGYPPERIVVAPNASDIERFDVDESQGNEFLAQHPELTGGPLVVYTGTLGKLNGVTYLAEIAGAMREINPAVKFLVVGGGFEKKLLRETADREGVLNQTFFILDQLPKNEMPKVLSAATVATSLFIDLPEMWNNSANKFFDALAARRPVMINYSGWQAELLRQSEAGIVVPPRDAKVAARTLNELLVDEGRLTAASRNAAALAKRDFDRDQLSRTVLRSIETAQSEYRR